MQVHNEGLDEGTEGGSKLSSKKAKTAIVASYATKPRNECF